VLSYPINKTKGIPHMIGYPVYMSIRGCIYVYTSIRLYMVVYTSRHIDARAFALFGSYAKLQSRYCNREIINCNQQTAIELIKFTIDK